MSQGPQAASHPPPAELLQDLVRFDTSNPPGNEAGCIGYVDSVLKAAGFTTSVLARDPQRPNLLTRLPGQGKAPPLLMYGHVDVVPAYDQKWQHPPFSGDIADGWLWGRGTLDMKGGVAMMLAALLRAKAESMVPPGEVILAVVSDEEGGSGFGARYLVEDHRHQFEGVRYAVGEFGGFTFYVGRTSFYPIMVAEKTAVGVLATMRGTSGHASVSLHGGAMAKLGRVLDRIEHGRLPVHIPAATQLMIEGMSRGLSFPSSLVLRQLLNPVMTDGVLKILGKQVEQFEPLLHNTVSPRNVVWADDPRRVPDKVGLGLGCLMLPGITPDAMMAELRSLIGSDAELELWDSSWYEPLPHSPDMGLFQTLSGILREAEPDGVPVPFLAPFLTDGRFFARLGIQTYGFLPMKLPRGFAFWEAAHGVDERIPVEALAFGADAIYKLMQRFGG